jgi:hypothetical protein
VDLEAYDGAVRAAISAGRLTGIQPAVLGSLTESSVLTLVSGRAMVPYDPQSQFLALVVEGLLRTSYSPPTVGRSRCAIAVRARWSGLAPCTRRTSPSPDVDVIGPMPYVALQRMLDAGAPRGMRNYWKSGCLRTLDAGLLEQIATAAL